MFGILFKVQRLWGMRWRPSSFCLLWHITWRTCQALTFKSFSFKFKKCFQGRLVIWMLATNRIKMIHIVNMVPGAFQAVWQSSNKWATKFTPALDPDFVTLLYYTQIHSDYPKVSDSGFDTWSALILYFYTIQYSIRLARIRTQCAIYLSVAQGAW